MNRFVYDEDLYGKKRSNPIATAFIIILGIALIWVLVYIFFYKKPVEVPLSLSDYDKIYIVFSLTGSPVPNVMTSAVLDTPYPYLLTGIAVKESNGTPWAVGDKGQSKGAFQVQEKHWGKVPVDVSEQAKQATAVLEALVESRGSLRCRTTLRRALAKYNGGTRPPKISYRYADYIIRMKESIKI